MSCLVAACRCRWGAIFPDRQGPHQLAVRRWDRLGDAGNEAQALLNIGPFISVSPNSGSAGTHLTINGWSFDGADSILVRFGATSIGYFSSNSNGDFSGGFNVPNVAPGLYTISATDSFGSVATTTFNVTGSAGTIAAALASSWLYLTTSGGSSQQFFTNSSGGAVNTLKVYLTGTGTVTISLGTSVLGTSIYSTSVAVSGAGWYNVTLPSTAHLAASSTFYLSVSPTSGATKWAFSNALTYKLNAGLMYFHGGTAVTSAFTFLHRILERQDSNLFLYSFRQASRLPYVTPTGLADAIWAGAPQ